MTPLPAVAATVASELRPGGALLVWLAVGALGGLVGAAATGSPLHRQPDGWTPAFVAAALLRRSSPDRIAFRDALVVHHAAGTVAGALYGLVGWSFAVVVGWPDGGRAAFLVGHALAVAVVVAAGYALFAHVVLPRGARGVYEERATAVRGQWLRSTLLFGGVLLVGGLSLLVVA